MSESESAGCSYMDEAASMTGVGRYGWLDCSSARGLTDNNR